MKAGDVVVSTHIKTADLGLHCLLWHICQNIRVYSVIVSMHRQGSSFADCINKNRLSQYHEYVKICCPFNMLHLGSIGIIISELC